MSGGWTSRMLSSSQLTRNQIFDMYQQFGLSIDVRQHLDVWIENNLLNHSTCTTGPPSPGYYDEFTLISALIAEIKRVAANNVGDTPLYCSLRRSAEYYETLDPSVLYSRFKTCLNEEKRLLSEQTTLEVTAGGVNIQQESNQVIAFTTKISILTTNKEKWRLSVDTMQSLLHELRIWREKRDSTVRGFYYFENHEQYSPTQVGNVAERDLQRIDQEIALLNQRIQPLEDEIVQLAIRIETELGQLVDELLNDFILKLKWSEPIPNLSSSLNEVRKWFAGIMDTIDQLGSLITLYLPRTSRVIIEQLLGRLDSMSISLKDNCLLVQRQPSQGLKTGSKFEVQVDCLFQERIIVSPQTSLLPAMQVSLLDEIAASLLFETKSPNSIPNNNGHLTLTGPFTTNEVRIRSDDQNGGDGPPKVFAQFGGMIIQANGEKRKNAMTQKYCLMFTSTIDINGVSHEVWCCSVPFVIYVHVNQIMQGWGNIFWDNHFRQPGRVPFATPSNVPWSKMTRALRDCFKTQTGTSWTLTDTNLRYIGEKMIFMTTQFDDNSLISREKFCEKDPKTKFCPWDRLYSIMELIRKHLRSPWENGYIVGFIDRQHVEENILPRAGPGSIVLRFSDNTLGAVSISFNVLHQNNKMEIASMAPFTDADLQLANLSDRLNSDKIFRVYHQDGKTLEEKLTDKAIAFPVKEVEEVAGGNRQKRDYVKPKWMLRFGSSISSTMPGFLLPNNLFEAQGPSTSFQDYSDSLDDVMAVLYRLE